MKKVLIVDDDEIIRVFVKRILSKKFGMDVVVAVNGVDGLNVLESERPDVVFLDVTMPVMDGVEFLEIVKKNAELKNIPIIVMSAISDKSVVARMLQLGIVDYLLKPLDYEGSSERIRQIFEKIKPVIGKVGQAIAPAQGVDLSKMKLLIADGDMQLIDLFRELYGDYFTVYHAASGPECLKSYVDNGASVVLIGEGLPSVNEEFTAKKIRDIDTNKKTEIYLIKSSPGDETYNKGLFNGVVAKSLQWKQLASSINSVVFGEINLLQNIEFILEKKLSNGLHAFISSKIAGGKAEIGAGKALPNSDNLIGIQVNKTLIAPYYIELFTQFCFEGNPLEAFKLVGYLETLFTNGLNAFIAAFHKEILSGLSAAGVLVNERDTEVLPKAPKRAIENPSYVFKINPGRVGVFYFLIKVR